MKTTLRPNTPSTTSRVFKNAIILFSCFFVISCGSDEKRVPSTTILEASRAQTNPLNYMFPATLLADTPTGLGSAYQLEQALQYEASCTRTSDSVGRIVLTCQNDMFACTETYAASGHFMRWECPGFGALACDESTYAHTCNHTDQNGQLTCQEFYDRNWRVSSSSCIPNLVSTSTCTTLNNNTETCELSDGQSTCVSTFNSSTKKIITIRCDNNDNSRTLCNGSDDNTIDCNYTSFNAGTCTASYSSKLTLLSKHCQ